jgi:MYXO-CTERM domain-containing protein
MPADGGWELVGINSFGFMMDGSSRVLCDDPDAAAGVTRVDAVIDWINEEMGLSGGDGGASGGGTDPGTGDGATDGGDPGADGSADGAADGAGDAGAGGGDTGVDAEQAADVTLGDATASVPEGDASDSKGVGCAAGGASAPGLGWVAAGALGLALRRRRAAR